MGNGDIAWMLTASALVLLMTPGLAFFYGGLVRGRNIVNTIMFSFMSMAVSSVVWVLWGYSLAFGDGNWFIGDFSHLVLNGLDVAKDSEELLFVIFQMMFAIITPALITGAIVERFKFTTYLVFLVLWLTLVYAPIAHWVWAGEGWLFKDGALDFAGGTVVHINAGIAGLVACIMLGRRKGFPGSPMAPHNVPLVVVGASMLWVGWFGFNAGSELAADGTAGMALLVTQVATATAAFTWMMVEWCTKGKPTAVGIATGAVAGLVAITPACGTVGPMGAIVIGIATALVCYWAATALKKKLGYDDSFDVFGVHGVGGIVGALLTGCLAVNAIGAENLGGIGESFSLDGLWTQAKAVLFTIFWSGVVAFIAIKIAGALCGGIRSDEDTETEGLDVKDHGEEGYSL